MLIVIGYILTTSYLLSIILQYTYERFEKRAPRVRSSASITDIIKLLIQQVTLVIVRPTLGNLVDVAVYAAPAAEGHHRDSRRHRVHRKVRQKLRHEVQLAAEVLRANRAGRVHQKHQFHLARSGQSENKIRRAKFSRSLRDIL